MQVLKIGPLLVITLVEFHSVMSSTDWVGVTPHIMSWSRCAIRVFLKAKWPENLAAEGVDGCGGERWCSWVPPPRSVALAFALESCGGVCIHAERLLAKAGVATAR